MDGADIANVIADILNLPAKQVQAAVRLLDDGCTLPFIARYRKDQTGGLDEVQLREIERQLQLQKELQQRRQTILKTIDEQGKLTAALRQQVMGCSNRADLESLYLPFRPKRKTRATAARDQGLQPLADILKGQQTFDQTAGQLLRSFVSAESGVENEKAALQGACDIVAEEWSEDTSLRRTVLEAARDGRIHSVVKRGKKEAGQSFEAWFDHSERLSRIPSHRFLAIDRGVSEGILRADLVVNERQVGGQLKRQLDLRPDYEFADALRRTVDDCLTRLLIPAARTIVFQELKEQSDLSAISVFAGNLRNLLLAAPAGQRITLGIDPGFRTGCKVAVVDGTGRFLDQATIYPTPPHRKTEEAAERLADLIARHSVDLIAIGNGTASRETESFVAQLIRDRDLQVTKVMVNEAGASVYSASELAGEEYPDLDVTIRGAISIAHRLQDPLAELVKIDPKAIGVGQYQHDVDQKQLQRALEGEIQSSVSAVGVNLNTASASLLQFVPGLNRSVARRIVQHRDRKGPFRNRAELTSVSGLGAKAFEQSAGFLRISDGDEPLDNSAVHPESYEVVQRMADHLKTSQERLVGNRSIASRLDVAQFMSSDCGALTIADIIDELVSPGRDPRSDFRTVQFAEDVQEISDVREGMRLEGVVTNVTHFGAFVDIGVHQDGLIHISQLADHFVQDPADELSAGDIVQVRVLEVDPDRKRISLSRRSES